MLIPPTLWEDWRDERDWRRPWRDLRIKNDAPECPKTNANGNERSQHQTL